MSLNIHPEVCCISSFLFSQYDSYHFECMQLFYFSLKLSLYLYPRFFSLCLFLSISFVQFFAGDDVNTIQRMSLFNNLHNFNVIYFLFISLQDLEVKLREVRGEITNGKSATDRGLLEEEIDNSKKGGEGNSIFNKKIKVEEKIDEELNTKENEFHGRILAE